mgnify:FL=1
MAFLLICAAAAALVQLALLSAPAKRRFLRTLLLPLLACLPLGAALLTALRKPAVPYLGWEFDAAMYLWLAGAILAGYLLAWALFALFPKRPPQ